MSTKFAFDLQIHVMFVFDFITNSYLYEYECVSNDFTIKQNRSDL